MTPLLIIGEVFVDFSVDSKKQRRGIRLGGVVHAARGLDAIGAPYAVAAVCPEYLRDFTEGFLKAHGCKKFINLGNITGSPNIMVIRDILETKNQGYEDILYGEKKVKLYDVESDINLYSDVLIFPGKYCLKKVHSMLSKDACVNLDISYDVKHPKDIAHFKDIGALFLSTSSDLFKSIGKSGFTDLVDVLGLLSPREMVLKENRGGLRIHNYRERSTKYVPAMLGKTKTSVGVGDVFSSTYVSLSRDDKLLAPHKSVIVSSAYARQKNKEDLKTRVSLGFQISPEEMIGLGGTILPWHERPDYQIYLAAPDFSNQDRRDIKVALKALKYHNFTVRRPVKENGELPPDSKPPELRKMYFRDIEMLYECSIIFAVPSRCDVGTLVEIGMAVERDIPVVVFDPRSECYNTMVVGGVTCYSSSLDRCLNAVFSTLSDVRKGRLSDD